MNRLSTRLTSAPLTRLTVLGLGIFVLALAAACGSDDAEANPDDAHDDNGHDGAAEVHEVTVVASDMLSFEPAEVRVPAGEPVRLTLNNEESVELHDWSIEHIAVHDVHEMGADHADHAHGDQHYDLHVAAGPGESGVLEFTAMEPGEYTFVCTVPGHTEAGMTGTLIVE